MEKRLVMSSNLVTYAGRFQPFGPHHYTAWRHCKEKFGDVFITTGGEVKYPNSPFSFSEKHMIMRRIFDIGEHWIRQVANPYNIDHLLEADDQKDRPFITCLSAKDANRLSHSKYFKEYSDDIDLKPSNETGYIYIMPEFKHDDEEISSTILRRGFAFERFKKKLFKHVYGEFDEVVFEMIKSRLSFMPLLREEYIK